MFFGRIQKVKCFSFERCENWELEGNCESIIWWKSTRIFTKTCEGESEICWEENFVVWWNWRENWMKDRKNECSSSDWGIDENW